MLGHEGRRATETGEDGALLGSREKVRKTGVCRWDCPADRSSQHWLNTGDKRRIRAHVEPEQLERRVRIVGNRSLFTRQFVRVGVNNDTTIRQAVRVQKDHAVERNQSPQQCQAPRRVSLYGCSG